MWKNPIKKKKKKLGVTFMWLFVRPNMQKGVLFLIFNH